MTVPPFGQPFNGGFGTPPPQWGSPSSPPPQWGAPAGPPPQFGAPPGAPQWGAPGGPPQWGPPSGPPPQRHWWLLAGLAGLVVIVVGAAILFTGGSKKSGSTAASSTRTTTPVGAPAPSGARSVPSTPGSTASKAPKSLADLLLSQAEMTTDAGMPMSSSSFESGSTPLTSISVTPSNCTSMYAPATEEVYGPSGFTEIAIAGFRGPGNSIGNSVIHSVAKFPSATAAQDFVEKQYATWNSCRHVALTAQYGDGTPGQLKFGGVGRLPDNGGVMLLSDGFTDLHKGDEGCGRAMKATNDIVIDVRMCFDSSSGHNSGGYPMSLVHTIQHRIDGP